MDVQPVVDLLELPPRLVAEQTPGLERHRITALQLHHLIAGGGLEVLVLIEALLGLAVKRHQIAEVHGIRRVQRFGGHLLEVGDQHAELGAPVAHVIEAQHGVAAELQNPRQRVANDRGAQVTHMHLLGDVGAGEIHHHGRRVLHRRNAKAWISQPGRHLRHQPLGSHRQIDEPRPGDLGLQAESSEGRITLQLRHDRCGDLTGRLLQGFGQGEGPIGLEVPEFRLARRRQLGIQGVAGIGERPTHRCSQLLIQGLGEAEHGPTPRRVVSAPDHPLPLCIQAFSRSACSNPANGFGSPEHWWRSGRCRWRRTR